MMSNIREKLRKYLNAFSRERNAKFPMEEEWVELLAAYNEQTRLFRSLLENEQSAREHDDAINAAQAAERQNAFLAEQNAPKNVGNGGQTPQNGQNASLIQARTESRQADQRHRLQNASFYQARAQNRTVARRQGLQNASFPQVRTNLPAAGQ